MSKNKSLDHMIKTNDICAFCTKCLQKDENLTTDCPGYPLNNRRMEQVERGNIDYISGAWTNNRSAK